MQESISVSSAYFFGQLLCDFKVRHWVNHRNGCLGGHHLKERKLEILKIRRNFFITSSFCLKSAPQSAHISLITVSCKHSVSSRRIELKNRFKWLEFATEIFAKLPTYSFLTTSPSLNINFWTIPEQVALKRCNAAELFSPTVSYKQITLFIESCVPFRTFHLTILMSSFGEFRTIILDKILRKFPNKQNKPRKSIICAVQNHFTYTKQLQEQKTLQ